MYMYKYKLFVLCIYYICFQLPLKAKEEWMKGCFAHNHRGRCDMSSPPNPPLLLLLLLFQQRLF